jgi:hypothetical protein
MITLDKATSEAETRRALLRGIDTVWRDGLIDKCSLTEIAQINELLNKGRLRHELEQAKEKLNAAQRHYNGLHEEAVIAGVL